MSSSSRPATGSVIREEVASSAQPIAQRLQSRHASFESVWLEYLVGYRQWARLPPDGSMDDMKTMERRQKIEQWKARPPLVDFRASL